MNNNKRVIFLLPGDGGKPVGGIKVAYIYADYIASLGYDVNIIHDMSIMFPGDATFYHRVKGYISYIIKKAFGLYHPGNWYHFINKLKMDIHYNVRHLPKGSLLFIAGYPDAIHAYGIKEIPNNNKFYLIQDNEAWLGTTEEDLKRSYRLGYVNLPIAPWLQDKVKEAGASSILLPNGFDFDYFRLSLPIEDRCPSEVVMLYHTDVRKGCSTSIHALSIVKKKIPQLHVTMFGTPEKPIDLPDWYTYYQLPDRKTHNKIYNSASILVSASEEEGFGLTVGEAMICGAAICCTDTGGFRMMVKNGETGLISPVNDVDALANNILSLITNNNLRIRLAKEGNSQIQKFTWDNSFKIITQLLEDKQTINK